METSPPAATIRDYLRRHLGQVLTETDPLPFPAVAGALAKGSVITRFGQVERYGYFLNQGIVQAALPGEDGGAEKILEFFGPGDFFAAYSSLLTQRPADVELRALTPCRVERFTHADLRAAYQTSLLANQLGRVVTEQLYLRRARREKDLLHRPVAARYADLCARQPALLAQLPLDKIARYLGIHPNSLSRIRRQAQRPATSEPPHFLT